MKLRKEERWVGEMADSTASGFEPNRARLFGLAYRMLGSLAEAEDLVQDAYVRWHQSDRDAIRNAEAWLVATATRLAIDQAAHAGGSIRHAKGRCQVAM